MNVKQRLTPFMYGWMTIIVLFLFSSVLLAILLKFTSLSNPLLDQLAIGIAFISLFISGLISGMKAKVKGWMIGASLGISYSLMIYLYQFLGFGEHFSTSQIFYHVGFFVVITLGSILGVNLIGTKD